VETRRPGEYLPSRSSQTQYWDSWNASARASGTDLYMQRLRAAAVRWAGSQGARPRILEVGCGTGWLSEALAQFGPVTGVDLSPKAIEIAKQRCPQAQFLCGDFSSLDLPQPFDVVVTADTIAHVEDQQAFVDRIAALLVRGGLLLLMSQNAYALNRSAWVRPVPGQIRRWPSLRELRAYLTPGFEIERITTAAPGGATSGIYRLSNSRKVWKIASTGFGEERVIRLLEALRLGNEWVIVARRR